MDKSTEVIYHMGDQDGVQCAVMAACGGTFMGFAHGPHGGTAMAVVAASKASYVHPTSASIAFVSAKCST